MFAPPLLTCFAIAGGADLVLVIQSYVLLGLLSAGYCAFSYTKNSLAQDKMWKIIHGGLLFTYFCFVQAVMFIPIFFAGCTMAYGKS